METFFALNRYLHITAGFIGFFVAPVALAVRKGGMVHRRWGLVFFWSMVVAGITALAGSQHIHSTFTAHFCCSQRCSASTWPASATAPFS